MYRTRIEPVLAALLVFGLAACGPIVELPGSGEPPQLFDLVAKSAPPAAGDKSATVMLEAPTLPQALRGDQIAYRPSVREIRYLSGVRWSERSSTLIYRYLVTSFETSSTLQFVDNRALDVPGQFRLRIDLRDFSLHSENGSDEVKIEASAMFLRNGPVEILGSRRFEVSKPVSLRDGIEAVAGAFNEALEELAVNIRNWAETEALDATG